MKGKDHVPALPLPLPSSFAEKETPSDEPVESPVRTRRQWSLQRNNLHAVQQRQKDQQCPRPKVPNLVAAPSSSRLGMPNRR